MRLIGRLCDEGPLSIAGLTANSRVTRQAVAKHLLVLRSAGTWCAVNAAARESIWQLERSRLDDARRYLDVISAQWDNALERLRDFVEIEFDRRLKGTGSG